jgi:hypothetical protein
MDSRTSCGESVASITRGLDAASPMHEYLRPKRVADLAAAHRRAAADLGAADARELVAAGAPMEARRTGGRRAMNAHRACHAGTA